MSWWISSGLFNLAILQTYSVKPATYAEQMQDEPITNITHHRWHLCLVKNNWVSKTEKDFLSSEGICIKLNNVGQTKLHKDFVLLKQIYRIACSLAHGLTHHQISLNMLKHFCDIYRQTIKTTNMTALAEGNAARTLVVLKRTTDGRQDFRRTVYFLDWIFWILCWMAAQSELLPVTQTMDLKLSLGLTKCDDPCQQTQEDIKRSKIWN